MKRILSTAAAALATTAFLATASAQPSQQPDDENSGDISQINGQLVPLGKHNEYHYSFKRWNLSTNPLGWMVGFYGASLSYGINQNVALRGDVNLYNPVGSDSHGYELGAGLPIYFRRTYQGVFLEPGVIVRRFDNDAATMGPQILVGWHWIWDSGFNVAMAFGMGRNWSTEGDTSYDTSGDKLFANGYLRFGYAF